MYPRLAEMTAVCRRVDPEGVLASDLSRRLGIVTMNDAFGRPQSVVVLGGTSDIARELLGRLATDRCRSVVLAGRTVARSSMPQRDLRHSVSHVETVLFDATETDDADKTVVRCFEAAGEAVDLVIVAVGELGHQEEDETDPDRIARMVTVNFTWPAAALSVAAEPLKRQGHGRIIVLSSVAGYRVRRSNYVYGSAKAGLDGFALGLSEGLRGSGVAIHIVRPGFVRTKMTVGTPGRPVRRRARSGRIRHRPGRRTRPVGDLVSGRAAMGLLRPAAAPPVGVAPVARLRNPLHRIGRPRPHNVTQRRRANGREPSGCKLGAACRNPSGGEVRTPRLLLRDT